MPYERQSSSGNINFDDHKESICLSLVFTVAFSLKQEKLSSRKAECVTAVCV